MSTAPPGETHLRKVADRVRKLHARAVRGSTDHEMSTAASVMLQHLNTHRPTVRYCYPAGARVRVLPARAHDTPQASKAIRWTKAHHAGFFTEEQRVTDEDIASTAIRKRYVAFLRNGYYIFVDLAVLDIRI